ncbi:hypothetical protein MKX01_006866 [Papaver californicum]|nr:hypothetical protein MKX01_006866 [Papaver californicum]
MSVGVCGKRLGFEKIFVSSSSPSNKISRRYSPVRGFGFGAESTQEADEKIEELQEKDAAAESRNPMDGASWVDIFVQEMKSASGIDDARRRAARILEAFEKSVAENARASLEVSYALSSKEIVMGNAPRDCGNERASAEHVRDNSILKRAVAIQHERNLEHEVKVREVEQLKHAIGQFQEQIRTLEMNNYTLKVHLQRAQGSSSIPTDTKASLVNCYLCCAHLVILIFLVIRMSL